MSLHFLLFAPGLLVCLIPPGCTRTYSERIEVAGPTPAEQMDRARRAVNEQRLKELRAQVKRSLSSLTDDDLATLNMTASEIGDSTGRTGLVVTISIEDSGSGQAAVSAAADILRPELEGSGGTW